MSTQELRLIPQSSFSHSHSHISSSSVSAPSAPGVYDRLRASLQPQQPLGNTLTSTHPLEARLSQWTETRETLKHAMLQREFGLAAPLQREMELLTVRRAAWGSMLGFADMSSAPSRSVHEDILMGRDAELDWEDVYPGPGWGEFSVGGAALGGDFHTTMESRFGMHW